MDTTISKEEVEKAASEGRKPVPAYPIPVNCNPRRVLKALQKLHMMPAKSIRLSDAALLPLTPFERGFVLGVITESQAKGA